MRRSVTVAAAVIHPQDETSSGRRPQIVNQLSQQLHPQADGGAAAPIPPPQQHHSQVGVGAAANIPQEEGDSTASTSAMLRDSPPPYPYPHDRLADTVASRVNFTAVFLTATEAGSLIDDLEGEENTVYYQQHGPPRYPNSTDVDVGTITTNIEGNSAEEEITRGPGQIPDKGTVTPVTSLDICPESARITGARISNSKVVSTNGETTTTVTYHNRVTRTSTTSLTLKVDNALSTNVFIDMQSNSPDKEKTFSKWQQ
ncbi:hypothetical protein OJAV_G00178490 [Oryzias javanicus]|uniref:Uncharacterized protein n=1 Tax=Oryzias javanicus TaxID=123683 RepID=A0A3S2NZ54_ORYJA|nr:hypothetical protein OJAV_G00178490 [Oryzias javanicus]